MAFYSQGKEFLNLPEQVEKNTTDIDALKTKDIADLKSKEAKNATDIANNTADLADLKSRTSAVEKNTTTSNGTITTGTLGVENKATFGNSVEVDGGLTLNSPSDLHFKVGDTNYTDFNSFKSAYYRNAFQFACVGITLYSYEEGSNYFDPSESLIGIGNATCLRGLYQDSTAQCEVRIPASNVTGNIDAASICLGTKLNGYTVAFCDKGNTATYNITQGFNRSTGLKKVTTPNGNPKIMYAVQAFYNCSELVEVGAFDMSQIVSGSTNSMFTGCTSLQHIHCIHWKYSFDISASTAFETDDLVEIIGNLDQVTTAQTLTMGSVNLAKLTQDQILVATGKGWTLA